MNTFTKMLTLGCLLAVACSGQAQEKHYAVVHYFQVPEGQKVEEYLAAEKLSQRVHQKAADSGFHSGRFLHRVDGGRGNRFVAIEVVDSLDKSAKGIPVSLREGLYNSEELQRLQHIDRLREVVRREIWEFTVHAKMRRDGGNPAKVVVQFLKANNSQDTAYEQMEQEVGVKLQQSRIDAAKLQSWVFLRRFAPAGSAADFNYVTFSGYSDQHAGAEAELVLSDEERERRSKRDALRTVVAEETWIPVMHVFPSRK